MVHKAGFRSLQFGDGGGAQTPECRLVLRLHGEVVQLVGIVGQIVQFFKIRESAAERTSVSSRAA